MFSKLMIFSSVINSKIFVNLLHELVVRTRQLDSVALLVRALHRNRRAAGSILVRQKPIVTVAFFAPVPG
jgi:hypothetical protein